MVDSSENDLHKLQQRFSAIYDQKEWGVGSGVGSRSINNLEYSVFLQRFIYQNNVRSVVDFGCGDWQFSRFIDWTGISYVGVDIVPELIERNRRDFSKDQIQFDLYHSLESLPNADLLLCKDV